MILLSFISFTAFAQTDKEIAMEKALQAIKLMDDGQIDESIVLLKESEQLDPGNFDIAYEIAFAYYLKEDYKLALDVVERVKDYKNTNYQLYQIWGNLLDLMDKPEEAIAKYDEGLKIYPEKGALYLEKGVVLESTGKYSEALNSYQLGIDANPEYPSNYYRAANLFLNSTNKVPGLIYGEIFLNMERTTERSLEMSKSLYDAYKSSIIVEGEKIELKFCDVIIDADKFVKDKRLPFCMIFAKNFLPAIKGVNEFNLAGLVKIRREFLKSYYEGDYKDYPNFLIDYLKKVDDQKLFDTYNYYFFQMGSEDEFDEWLSSHQEDFNAFRDWYTNPENILKPTQNNYYKYEY